MTKQPSPKGSARAPEKVALVLQGGGALGSYQAGVYASLADANYLPDWVAGISIGAINAAIIAGNPPETRVAQLRKFWEQITTPSAGWPSGVFQMFEPMRRQTAAHSALFFGQDGFFSPRKMHEWTAATKPISYYDTTALKATLEDLVDFDRINSTTEPRLSVGAVNVRTGRFAYFDSTNIAIRAEHIMASGALPPGFPAVEIDGEHYWDGGIVSNTPLAYVLDQLPRRSRLTFQVDVFQAYGLIPTTLDEVTEREKDIRYASRTRMNTDIFGDKHEVSHAINELFDLLPPELAKSPQAQKLYKMGCVTQMDIVQLIYRPFARQGPQKDYEFSRLTMDQRWTQGQLDAQATLDAAPWLAPKTQEVGVRVFDVQHDQMVAKRKAATGLNKGST
ncbi:MAG: NTE family protein [Pseudorhodobacter sp.]|jgi:NTE family protein